MYIELDMGEQAITLVLFTIAVIAMFKTLFYKVNKK